MTDLWLILSLLLTIIILRLSPCLVICMTSFKLFNNQRSEETLNTNMAGVLVYSSVTKSGFSCWILDSGTTDHMISDLNLMHDIKDISKTGLPVNLPNGLSVLIKHVGKCRLTSDIVLNNVFYVSDFKFNMLFVSRLTNENNCVVKFLKHSCII